MNRIWLRCQVVNVNDLSLVVDQHKIGLHSWSESPIDVGDLDSVTYCLPFKPTPESAECSVVCPTSLRCPCGAGILRSPCNFYSAPRIDVVDEYAQACNAINVVRVNFEIVDYRRIAEGRPLFCLR